MRGMRRADCPPSEHTVVTGWLTSTVISDVPVNDKMSLSCEGYRLEGLGPAGGARGPGSGKRVLRPTPTSLLPLLCPLPREP